MSEFQVDLGIPFEEVVRLPKHKIRSRTHLLSRYHTSSRYRVSLAGLLSPHVPFYFRNRFHFTRKFDLHNWNAGRVTHLEILRTFADTMSHWLPPDDCYQRNQLLQARIKFRSDGALGMGVCTGDVMAACPIRRTSVTNCGTISFEPTSLIRNS